MTTPLHAPVREALVCLLDAKRAMREAVARAKVEPINDRRYELATSGQEAVQTAIALLVRLDEDILKDVPRPRHTIPLDGGGA